MHPSTDISNTWFHGSYSSGLLQIISWSDSDDEGESDEGDDEYDNDNGW